jgi:hypothetical protein
MAQALEHLLCMHKTLGSILKTTKKKKTKNDQHVYEKPFNISNQRGNGKWKYK